MLINLRFRVALVMLAVLLAGAATAHAATIAHFAVYEIRNLCNVKGDYDYAPWEEPEAQYRAAILDGVDDTYHDNCTDIEDHCGSWDFDNYTVNRTIPSNQGAWFYFGLFDEDVDEDDVIGNHWVYSTTSESSSHWEWNNDLADPDYSPVCGSSTEGNGKANNYQLRYRIWFTDTTGPISIGTPRHLDGSAINSGWDNDSRLDFDWTAAVDPDTNISAYHLELLDETTGVYHYTTAEVAYWVRSVSFCTSDCTFYLNPQDGHQYRFRVRASNGRFPSLLSGDRKTLWSGSRSVRVDRDPPSTSITNPQGSSWQRETFSVSFSDSDGGSQPSGINTSSCRWRVLSNWTERLAWSSRGCNGSANVTVGSGSICRDQGVNRCLVYADSDDVARNGSNTAWRFFSIDWTNDPIDFITATDSDGNTIPAGAWTTEQTPSLAFGIDTGADYAPISGYSWAVDDNPDCGTLEVSGGTTGSASLAGAGLSDGTHTFRVRAVDAADNCGGVGSLTLRVDTTGDPVSGLTVYTANGGDEIVEAHEQQDNDPYLEWSATSPGDAPIVGYAVGLNAVPNCNTADFRPETSYAFPENAIPDGDHVLYVRAKDAAGNCGTSDSFVIWVRTGNFPLAFSNLNRERVSAGQTLTFSVTSTDTAYPMDDPPVVSVAGVHPATPFGGGGDYTYNYSYVVVGDEVVTENPSGAQAPLIATGRDRADNEGSGRWDGLVFDFVPPPLVGALAVEPGVATTDDEVVVVFEAAEAIVEAPPAVGPKVAIAGVADAADDCVKVDDHFECAYTVGGGEGEGPVTVALTITDLAGNDATHLGHFDLDTTPPVVDFLTPDSRIVADLGDEIEITWETDDAHPATVSIYLSVDGGVSYGEEAILENIPDTGSATWTVTGPATNLARLLVKATDQVGLPGEDEGIYDFRIRDPVADHVVAFADDGEAGVGETELVNLQVVDQLGDSVEDEVDVTVTVTGSAVFSATSLEGASVGGNAVTGTTDALGQAVVAVTDIAAERVDVTPHGADLPELSPNVGVEIRFRAGAADHLVLHVDDGQAAVGDVEVLTLAAVDVDGNPTESDVDVRVAVDGFGSLAESTLRSVIGLGSPEIFGRLRPDGTATIRVTDPVAETVVVTASSDSLPNLVADEGAVVTFLQESEVDPLQVTIEAAPRRVFADGEATSLITVTPRNAVGEAIGSGLLVDVLSDFGDLTETVDEGDGTYTAELSSEACREQPALIGARVEDVLVAAGAQVTFTCDEVVSATLEADPETIVADGETCSELALALYDGDGELLPAGQEVHLSATYGQLSAAEDLDDGRYAASLCSDVCAEAPIQVTAEVNGVSLGDLEPPVEATVAVECLPVDPVASTVTAQPRSLPADGRSASTITVTPIRQDGVSMGSGVAVAIETTLGEVTTPFDVGDGTYTAQLTSSEPGEASITARVGGIALESAPLVAFYRLVSSEDVELRARLLGSPPSAGETVLVEVEVVNRIDRDIEDAWVSVAFDDDSTLVTDAVSWMDDPAAVTFDDVAGHWEVELGTIPEAVGATPNPRMWLTLQISSEALTESILRLQAHSEDEPISQVEVLAIALADDSAGEPITGAEACGCGSRIPARGGASGLALVAASGLLLAWRRRRAR